MLFLRPGEPDVWTSHNGATTTDTTALSTLPRAPRSTLQAVAGWNFAVMKLTRICNTGCILASAEIAAGVAQGEEPSIAIMNAARSAVQGLSY